MDTRDIANVWLANVHDAPLHEQLSELVASGDQQAIDDAFYQDLSFGTAGLRGIIGPGTNRMNIYTVGRATQGLADYINASAPADQKRVAIARDSRHQGDTFVRHAATVLAANGITAYLYPRIEPTPALSFAVRDLGCFSGICMTASHNPAPYNGYKVYGPDGCQITSQAADAISAAIKTVDPFADVLTMDFDAACSQGLIRWIEEDTLDRFVDAVCSCAMPSAASPVQDLKVVYTPLNGTGLECISRMFSRIGVSNVTIVESQKDPDGDFPTCTYPNPETREALEQGIDTCRNVGADILLATDPDADRMGIAVRHGQDFVLPTGNEIGILMLDYLCKQRKDAANMPQNPIAVSTIVSSAMIDSIAQEYGVEIKRTLTGFKYIGDIITNLEQTGEQDRFIFGFEESYGYLSGTHVRDKDAVNACLILCQMAAYYKARGMDLIEALDELYAKHGYFANRTINVAFPGAEGAQTMRTLMESLRTSAPTHIAEQEVAQAIDYLPGRGGLPCSNVIEFVLADGSKVIFRPSGTEPKIKAYLFGIGATQEAAQNQLDALEQGVRNVVGS